MAKQNAKPKSPLKIFKEKVEQFQSALLTSTDLQSIGAARVDLYVALKDILSPTFIPELEKDIPELLEIKAGLLEKKSRELFLQAQSLEMEVATIRSLLPPKEVNFRREINGEIAATMIPSANLETPTT